MDEALSTVKVSLSELTLIGVYSYCYTQFCKVKVKVTWIYMAPGRETSKALRHGSHSVYLQLHRCLPYLVSVHQMAPP